MPTPSFVRRLAGVALLALVLAACADANAGEGGAAQGGGLSMAIATPANGDEVSTPFEVRIDASVPLGEPDTGNHHVHLCFDGASCDEGDYIIVYGDRFTVEDLPPGEHTIEASLRNADHSAAGVTDTISVVVADGPAGGAGETGGAPATGGGGGYDY
jgi:hypothetical protein